MRAAVRTLEKVTTIVLAAALMTNDGPGRRVGRRSRLTFSMLEVAIAGAPDDAGWPPHRAKSWAGS